MIKPAETVSFPWDFPCNGEPKHALADLVRHVAYADHWMRHTRAFADALQVLGWRLENFDRGPVLLHGKTVVSSPFPERKSY